MALERSSSAGEALGISQADFLLWILPPGSGSCLAFTAACLAAGALECLPCSDFVGFQCESCCTDFVIWEGG